MRCGEREGGGPGPAPGRAEQPRRAGAPRARCAVLHGPRGRCQWRRPRLGEAAGSGRVLRHVPSPGAAAAETRPAGYPACRVPGGGGGLRRLLRVPVATRCWAEGGAGASSREPAAPHQSGACGPPGCSTGQGSLLPPLALGREKRRPAAENGSPACRGGKRPGLPPACPPLGARPAAPWRCEDTPGRARPAFAPAPPGAAGARHGARGSTSALPRVPPGSASTSGTPGLLPGPAQPRHLPVPSRAFCPQSPAPALSLRIPISCTDPCGLPPFLLPP